MPDVTVTEEVQKEYETLSETIRYHMDRYYNRDAPEISDYEYDQMMLRLKALEQQYPVLRTKDSPTQIVGGKAKREAGVIVEHHVPMLSIQDVFTLEEVEAWVREVQSVHPDALFVVEQKIDGLSMSLRYENGRLILAETRGDGLQGEDVTDNALVIPDVRTKLEHAPAYLEVRGEVYMRHEDFLKTNELQLSRGKKTFANPRNCAAGTLRQLDSAMVKKRGLSFFVFNVQDVSDDVRGRVQSHEAGLRYLKETLGMRTCPGVLCRDAQEIFAAIEKIGALRGTLDYDIDGAVVKIDQTAFRNDFPGGSKYSAGHIAYKYPPEEREAVIESVELSVGMTGRINPTAVFTPVSLCGTTVSRATLHNQDFIDKLGIGIGATVLVYKSGEIIPKIKAVVREKTPADVSVYQIPKTCPVCGGTVTRGMQSEAQDAESAAQETAADMYCTNPDCPAKLERRILNFVSRDAMDMKGFGSEYLKALIDHGYIRNIADLYSLKQHRDELIDLGLIGKEVNTDKLLKVIEDSKENDPWRLLSGLAIANVGRTLSRTLLRHFHSIDNLRNASFEELLQADDVGEVTAHALQSYFADETHAALLDRLKAAGVRMEEKEALGFAGADGAGAVFAGKIYCVTGDLTHFQNRDELIAFIEARGGKVTGSVSKKTSALINNDAASVSGKNKKAKELGIPIITEEALLAEANGSQRE